MTALKDIETLTREYADSYAALTSDVEALEAAMRTFKKKALPGIKRAAERAAVAKEKLKAAIEGAPALFEKPRTRLFHGVKVGLLKGKGELRWDDPNQVVRLIRKHFPDQVEVLIRVIEAPVKPALAQLPAADLKRVGVTVVETGDQVIVKVADSDIEKMVDALFKDEADAAKRAA